MNALILFLIKSVFVSAVLTTWYWFMLRNKRLHNYNRFYLLFTLYASIQLPLLHFQWFTIQSSTAAFAVPLSNLVKVISDTGSNEQKVIAQAVKTGINWNFVILIIAALVSLYLLTVLAIRIIWVMSITRKYPYSEMDGVRIVNTDLAKAPFSFLTWVFWKDTISLHSETGKLILRHELTHIRQRHTYDKLACQVITCIFWFNPFYWFIHKELSMIHEFIADENAIAENDTEAFAKMLLLAHNSGRYLVPEHQFFSSPIKRRLVMLQTSNKTTFTFRRLMVLPLIASAIFAFSFTAGKTAKYEVARAEKKIVLVLDAGHGGSDGGCKDGNLLEKDVNLKIVKRIVELAPAYNIEVHLTRAADENVPLEARADLSNKLHPDAFISIHVNNTLLSGNAPDSFEVFIPRIDQPVDDRSMKLANAVTTRIIGIGGVRKLNPMNRKPHLYVLTHNSAPCMLIEVGDIKCKKHMKDLNDPDKLDEFCSALLNGVVEAQKG